MSKVKKIIKAEQGVKLNIPQDNTVKQPESVIPNPYSKKFKLGSRDITLDEKFLLDLEDDLRNSGQTGSGVKDMLDLIKSGEIQGIDEGGNFYGTNIGGTEKKTNVNRAWGIGNKDIRERQDISPKIVKSIWSIYNKNSAPVVTPPVKKDKIDLSDNPLNILQTHVYGGNKVDTQMLEDLEPLKRAEIFGGGLGKYIKTVKGQGEYDKDIYGDTLTENQFKRFKGYEGNIEEEWAKTYTEALKDGVINPSEFNDFYIKTGINPSSLFVQKTIEAQKEETAETKDLLEKAALEEAQTLKEDAIKNSAKEKGLDSSYTFTGDENADPNDMKNWTRTDPETKTPYTGYTEYEEWNPYSNKNTSGHWIKGKYYGNDIPTKFETPAEQNDFLNLIENNKKVWENRYSSGVGGEEIRRSELAKKHFYGYPFMNMTGMFDKAGNNQIFSIKGVKGDSNYGIYDTKTDSILRGHLARNADGTIKFVAVNGPTINLGRYIDDASKLNYDLSKLKPIVNRSSIPFSPLRKKGGRINLKKINKLQFGGKAYKPVTAEKLQSKADFEKADRERTAKTSEINDSTTKLTLADKAQLAALSADLTGLIAGIIPGVGNVAAGASGLASSLATGYSDIARDGLDWGDVGSLGLNLAMDAATFIPGVGSAAKAAKIAKAVKKSKNVLMLAAGFYGVKGLYDGVSALNEKGVDNMTLDDWQKIMTGLQAVAMGTKHGVHHMGTKKINPQTVINVDNKDISFNNREAAEAYVKSRQNIKNKLEEVKKLKSVPDNSDGTILTKAQGELDIALKQHKDLGIKDENIDAFDTFKPRTEKVLNPLSWKGLKKDGKYQNPIGSKDRQVKYTETTDRAIRQKDDEGNWAEKASARWLRANEQTRNLFKSKPNTTPEESSIEEKSNWLKKRKAKMEEAKRKKIEQEEGLAEELKKYEDDLEETIDYNKKHKWLNKDNKKASMERRKKRKDDVNKAIQKRKDDEALAYLREQNAKKAAIEKAKRVAAGKKGQAVMKANEAKRVRDEELTKILDKPKPKKTNKLKEEAKGENFKKFRSDSKDSKLSKNKASDRKNYDKTKKALRKQGIEMRKDGGILKLHGGNSLNKGIVQNPNYLIDSLEEARVNNWASTMLKPKPFLAPAPPEGYAPSNTKTKPIVTAQNQSTVETGRNWKNLANFGKDIASPANARVLTTLLANRQMMKEIEKSPRPTNDDPISLERMRGVGISSIQPQLSDVNQSVNNQRHAYSDAKINVAMKLAQNANADKIKQGLYNQLSQQNQQIDASNQQISQQEALQNAQIAAGNKNKQDAYNQWILSNKLGNINTTGNVISTRLLEEERKQDLNKQRMNALNDQETALMSQVDYQNVMNNFQNEWSDKAKKAGKTTQEYLSSLSEDEKKDFTKRKQDLQTQFQLNLLKKRKATYLQSGGSFIPSEKLAKGGKLTLSERKELEDLRAYNKRIADSHKDFNKLMIERSKSHDKTLSLLSKDLRLTVKQIMGK